MKMAEDINTPRYLLSVLSIIFPFSEATTRKDFFVQYLLSQTVTVYQLITFSLSLSVEVGLSP